METQNTPEVNNQKTADSEAEKKPVDAPKAKKSGEKESKSWLVFLILGLLMLAGGVTLLLLVVLKPVEEKAALVFPTIPSKTTSAKIYSNITGQEIADESLNHTPVYCIQTPNGTDGARPQAGLNDAGVVFEAIAEAGITRFAAIYQNPSTAVIGPIRSLRLYYLEWDTPFDCTIVHAGGADDAIAAVRNGGYKDLTENYTYMYRGTVSSRRWNNLFTNGQLLKNFTNDRGYTTSNPQGFAYNTPEVAEENRVNALVSEKLSITKPATGSTSTLTPKVSHIKMRFGNVPNYNPVYDYDVTTNTYKRSYESGALHNVYKCPAEDLGKKDPENVCELQQLSPSVVIGIVVNERKAWDNYHESITTTGSGTAYIFQNGTAIKGTWNKNTRADQLKFYDENGAEVALNPGQVIVSAIPNYGSVEY